MNECVLRIVYCANLALIVVCPFRNLGDEDFNAKSKEAGGETVPQPPVAFADGESQRKRLKTPGAPRKRQAARQTRQIRSNPRDLRDTARSLLPSFNATLAVNNHHL